MFGTHFYNKNIRNIVVLFGTVFNDISIRRMKSDGTVERELKVPIAYGPSEKFLAKLNQKDVLSLPRMSFEITDYAYDPTRKLQTTKKYKKVKGESVTELNTIYNPVPYDFNITLTVMVKYSDDGSQILEQILPFFTPEFHVAMNEMSTMGIVRDIPIILNSVTTEDTYEGDFITRRALLHTLEFTVKAHIYGKTSDQGIIREVDANIGAIREVDANIGTNLNNAKNVNINITPKALTDLNSDEVIDEADNVLTTPANDFGFIETWSDLPSEDEFLS
jgi:hypothetical protein|tara:strand:+ start:1577 stop:2407 length:831 start_codon:yes stop_codon:yes gene_type:complete